MRFQTLIFSITVLLVVMVSGCGVGGGGTPITHDPEPGDFASYWGSPGGTPGNTRLSNNIGPQTNQVGWTTLGERGTSSNAVVTPDGTVVVGFGYALVGFNPDGSVRWRVRSEGRIAELVMDIDGTICCLEGFGNFQIVTPAGIVLFEYQAEDRFTQFLGFGPEGTMYLDTYLGNDMLTALNMQGEVLFETSIVTRLGNFLVLPNGRIAYTSSAAGLVVLDSNGNELWSVTDEDLRVSGLWLGGDDLIYAWLYSRTNEPSAYMSYGLDGTPHARIEPDLPEGNFWMLGLAQDGRTIWVDKGNKVLLSANPDGSIAWQHNSPSGIGGSPVLGNHGEVYVSFSDPDAGIGYYKIQGFNTDGEIFLTLAREYIQSSTIAVGNQGKLFFGGKDKFYAYEPSGVLAWSYDLGGRVVSITVGPEGNVYSAGENVVSATSPSGIELWRYAAQSTVREILVNAEGQVYLSVTGEILVLSSEGNLLQRVAKDYGWSQMALSHEGNLVGVLSTGIVKALMPDMTPSWEFVPGTTVRTEIAIGGDGSLYFGGSNGLLYAISPKGKKQWTFDMQDIYVNTPAVLSGAIYATSSEGGLFKLGLDGRQIWRFDPPSYCNASPIIGPDGTVYISTYSRSPGEIFNPRLGIPSSEKTPAPNLDSPTANSLGLNSLEPLTPRVSEGLGLYAINPIGIVKWHLFPDDSVFQPACVDGAGNIYLRFSLDQLLSLNPDGTERWSYNSDSHINTNPIIGVDGSVIFSEEADLINIGPGG